MATQAPRELNRDFNRGERGRMENQAPQMAAPQDRGERNRDFSRGERDRDFGRGERTERGRDFGRGERAFATQAPQDRGEQYRDFNRGDRNRNDFNDRRGGYRGGDFREGRGNFRGPRRDFSTFRDFHRDFRAPHRFRVSSYRRPPGWYSHRWAFGEFLPAAFWARDYWLIDFADYDLPPPPYGAIWVRVDRDALLVDEDSGEIITVVYDVFY